jgi:Protein of unknown function (DUF2917)
MRRICACPISIFLYLYSFICLFHSRRMQANNVLNATSTLSGGNTDEVSRVTLREGAVWSRKLGRARGLAVHCDKGSLWVTQEGLADDCVLTSGETARLRGPGLVVVSAFGQAGIASVSELKAA